MRDKTWRTKWQNAYNHAGFYHSEKNTEAFWNQAALSYGGSLAGTEHIRLITDYMFENHFLNARSTVLDLGCGTGDYVISFAQRCFHVTAVDYAKDMLDLCRKRCAAQLLNNVSFVSGDFLRYAFTEKFDCVMACLNPSAYHPAAFDLMLSLSAGYVIYFSMDLSVAGSENEPVYCGCNSVQYAEKYMSELKLSCTKIHYVHSYRMRDGTVREIPFAYLVVRK